MNAIENFDVEVINIFPETHPLSNCFIVPVVFNDITFPSVEHAYQAMKFYNPSNGWEDNLDILEEIMGASTGPKAKDIKNRYSYRTNQMDDNYKVELITKIMRAKFLQNTELLKVLLDTGDDLIVEDDPGEEDFWGINLQGKGDNVIGAILMMLREEFRN